MNIRKEITTLLNLNTDIKDILTSSVMVHIDRAERYYRQAKKQNDEQYYTDVVYRTNQAYEGMLKTAYLFFEGVVECNLNTYQLEEYFEGKQIFNDRVKKSFTFYRKFWRNTSVHDHELFFNRDDAFLAIVNVSAFIYILLNQILEYQSARIAKFLLELENYEADSSKDTPITDEIIIEQLKQFYEFPKGDAITGNNMPQIIGAIKGYLEGKLNGIEVITHYKGEDVLGYQPDIIINYNDNTLLIIEVKNEYTKQKLEFGYRQLKDYLFRSEVKRGVLYFYTDKKDTKYEINREWLHDREIITLKPDYT